MAEDALFYNFCQHVEYQCTMKAALFILFFEGLADLNARK
jgi:hypothetical protein